ncbi:MAG: diacylglycerol kinase family protein [Chloroflexi bacterium]|nr:diacylglycerol kinase family protein [Chloroflexota bacterium]
MKTLARIAWSFSFAGQGLGYLVRTQPNFGVHLVALTIAIAVAALLGVRDAELAVVLLASGLVLSAEAFNTAVEAVVDLASPESHPLAKIAKDVSAGAVLLAAVTAIVVGLIVILPRLFGALHP